MGKILMKFCDLIDRINDYVGKTTMWIAFIIMILTVYEVVSRYVFKVANDWIFEVTIMAIGAQWALCGGFALSKGAHVAIDILSGKCSKKVQAFLDIISYCIFFFPTMIIIFIKGIEFAGKSWAVKEVTWSRFPAPLYLQKTIIPVMAFLLLIQGVAMFVRRINEIITKTNKEDEGGK
ncbi:MAG: TRAP transporter small permease subunit [Spirochaetia bacterium]|nr:TRAP transporter small permease subunit [Spirochaetia bacterium]